MDGHRWSLDDLVTAWVASEACGIPPRQVLDLGCGIGSVLLLLAWRFPAAMLHGIEAQAMSVDLARRSLRWNGVEPRCSVVEGDFRDPQAFSAARPFDLITGTPPYLPLGTGRPSGRPQKLACNFETRGGVEAYCAAAAPLLAPGGILVLCAQAGQHARVHQAAAGAGLTVRNALPVIPRAGKAPLFSVYTMTAADHGSPARVASPLTVRDGSGARTPAFRRVRVAMGLPP